MSFGVQVVLIEKGKDPISQYLILYIVLKLSHNNTIRVWFLPDFACWWIPSQAMANTVGTLRPRSRYIYIVSTCFMSGMSPLKNLFCFILQLQSFFSHDTMKSLEVYAFEVLSSNIILPLRWADTIIVAILCPPYMYCIIYNNFRIYLAHNSFNGFWQVVHHIFHVK